MDRLLLRGVVVLGLLTSACAASGQSATRTTSVQPASAAASQPARSPLGKPDCALAVKQVHVHGEMNTDFEIAATLDPRSAPYRVWMTGDGGIGTPVAWVSAVGEGWSDHLHILENAPGEVVTEYSLDNTSAPGRGWHHAFSEVGTHVIEMRESILNGCSATLVFEVFEAIPQVLPTGDCALVVKQVHRFADMEPELSTILDAPALGAPYRVALERRGRGGPSISVSVFGESWGMGVHVIETPPDGIMSIYTNANRPRPNQSMTTELSKVGTHVLELSSISTDCTATLVFEVTDPA